MGFRKKITITALTVLVFAVLLVMIIYNQPVSDKLGDIGDDIDDSSNNAPEFEINVISSEQGDQKIVLSDDQEPPEILFSGSTQANIHPEVRESLSADPEQRTLEVIIVAKDKETKDGFKQKKTDISDNTFSVELTPDEIEELGDDIKVFPNREYSMLVADSVSVMHAESFWNEGYTGQGIRIAILDTGVDSDHPMLSGRIVLAEAFMGSDPEDYNGHGTHVAGIAAGSNASGGFNGVAPGADIINAKVLDNSGSGTTASIAAGIYWAIDPDGDNTTDDGADIISMSLGAPYSTPDPVIDAAIHDAILNGVTVVIASGNCGPGNPCGGYIGVTTPGNNPEAITVGAVNNNLEWQSFSGGGIVGSEIKPDVVAPGVDITSAAVGGGYLTKQGTSMSTPMVAGAVALILQNESGLSPEDMKDLLAQNAVDLGDPGKDVEYGWGFVDLSLILSDDITNTTNTTNTTQENNETNVSNSTYELTNNLIQDDIGDYVFRTVKNRSIQKPSSISNKMAIYSKDHMLFYVEEITFSDVYNLSNFLSEHFPLNTEEALEFINYDYNYINYKNRTFWYNQNTVYMFKSTNHTDSSFLLDSYSNTTGNNVGSDFESNIQNLREFDMMIFKSMAAANLQSCSPEKLENFTAQFGGPSPAEAYELEFNTENRESYWTEGAENWYHTSTLRRGDLEFGIKDIDAGDDIDIYVLDWIANETLCFSNEFGSVDDSCIVNKWADYEWAFYILIDPFTIEGLWGEGTLYTSGPDCSVEFLEYRECRAGEESFGEYQFADCTTDILFYEDCDDYDDDGEWEYSCFDNNLYKSRTSYDYSCFDDTGGCDEYIQTIDSGMEQFCGSFKTCVANESVHECVQKTCTEMGYNDGQCSFLDDLGQDGECIYGASGDVYGCWERGDIKCWVEIYTCTADEYCDDPLIGAADCFLDPCAGSTVTASPRCSNDLSETTSCEANLGETMGFNNQYHSGSSCVDTVPNWVCVDWWNDNSAQAGSVSLDGHNWDWCFGNCGGLGAVCDTGIGATATIDLLETDNNNRPLRVLVAGWSTDLGTNLYDQHTMSFTNVDNRVCGDGTCDVDEVCAEDCLVVERFSSLPSSVDEDTFTEIRVVIENIGSVTQTGNVEVGLIPTNFYAQNSSHDISGCCENNTYFDTREVTRGPFATNVYSTFTIRTPNRNSIDNCDATPPPNSAWGTSFKVIAGAYDICVSQGGSGYYSDIEQSIVVNPICPDNQCTSYVWGTCTIFGGLCCAGDDGDGNPDTCNGQYFCNDDNSWSECSNIQHNSCEQKGDYYCAQDSGLWKWRNCPTGCSSGECNSAPICTVPDGLSSDCDCDSNRDCEAINDSLMCDLGPSWDACIDKNLIDECDFQDQYLCYEDDVYRCDRQNGRLKRILSDVCTHNEVCPDDVAISHLCKSEAGYDLILEHASSGTVVNKQPGDSLYINLYLESAGSHSIQYDSSAFTLENGPCISGNFNQGSNICKFQISDSALESSYSFTVNEDTETVKIIEEPYSLYLTNVDQLFNRFSGESTGVEILLAKTFEKASRMNGIVYNLDKEITSVDHPFDYSYFSYKSNINYDNIGSVENEYAEEIGKFVNKKCKYCVNIVVVGDDYVVPNYRSKVMTRENDLNDYEGLLDYWFRPNKEKYLMNDINLVGKHLGYSKDTPDD
ncbi:S8 family serine peptidase, partial [Thermoproteota archaeon]